MSAFMPILSAGATIMGGVMQAQGIRAQGAAQQQQANYQAAQMDIKAKEEHAAAQRDQEQLKRNKELALSALQARSAASGFDASDPTAMQIGEDIARYGTLQELMAQYGGLSRRTGLEDSARGRRAEGRAARQGSRLAARGTIFSSVADGFGRFAY